MRTVLGRIGRDVPVLRDGQPGRKDVADLAILAGAPAAHHEDVESAVRLRVAGSPFELQGPTRA